MNFKPQQRVILEIPKDAVWHDIIRIINDGESPEQIKATFLRYRSEEEKKEWRTDDDAYIQIDNDAPRVFPSKWLRECFTEKT